MPIRQVDPRTVAALLKGEPKPALLDVRTIAEAQLASLPDSLLIPLHELEERADELEALRGREVIVYCHHGVRSLHGAAFLEALGFSAASMSGGIEQWSLEIDPTVPRY